MKGWNKDGERVDLLPWQDEEVRAYLKWVWNPDPASPYSRFMYSKQVMADEDRVFQTTIARIGEAAQLFHSLKKLWDNEFEDVSSAIEIYLEAQREYGHQE